MNTNSLMASIIYRKKAEIAEVLNACMVDVTHFNAESELHVLDASSITKLHHGYKALIPVKEKWRS